MKNNQKGFSIAAALIVLVVVGLIGGVGWYVYEKNNSTTPKTTVATVKQHGITETSTTSVIKYLTIQEWKVRMKLPVDLKDATYAISDDHRSITLSTPRQDELSMLHPECKDANKSVAIVRALPGDDHFGTPFTTEELAVRGTKIGDYYFYPDGGQSCSGTQEELSSIRADVEEVGKIRAELGSLQKTIVAY